jgi:hypothetical protein
MTVKTEMKRVICILVLIVFYVGVMGQVVERIEGKGLCGAKAKRGGKVIKKSEKGEIVSYLKTPPPHTEAVDPTLLVVNKNDDATVLYLSWNEDDSPFLVSRSTDPSFQAGVEVLEKDATIGTMQISSRADKILECFDVSGRSVVSYPTQGIGYDPDPPPSIPSLGSNVLWWGDELDITSNYLEPTAKSNFIQMGDVASRAFYVGTTGNFGTSAKFIIPDDARSFYPVVVSQGRVSDPSGNYPFVFLSPKGYEYVSGVKGISYAPQTGKVWLAGSGNLFELDLFKTDPEPGAQINSFSNPLISRVTDDGRIFAVEGANGASEVFQIDVSSGAMTHYAYTTDDSFTRAIYPKGIGADPDGSACYIVDGNNGKVVKIPAGAGPGTSTIKDNWGNRTFNFSAMPIGIDVNRGHYVIVSSGDGYIYKITSQTYSSSDWYIGAIAKSIEIDRDYSITTYAYFFYETDYVFANCFNKNAIGDNDPAYHSGLLTGDVASGLIELDPHWLFVPYRDFPQNIVLNREGINYPYSSPYQVSDRVLELVVSGWPNRPVKLRVVDPPDLAPYAPDGGWNPSTCLPYKGNDNVGMTDYGLCIYQNCSDGMATEKLVTIDSTWTKKVYLKVPARYSGNNFQVEVEKTDYSGNPLPETKIAAASPIYTTWKRVYVERDKMFRKGGLLYEDGSEPVVIPAKSTSLKIMKGPNGVKIDNLNNGDKIAIFDTETTFEKIHDEAYIGNIDRTSYPNYALITLKQSDLLTDYETKYSYTTSPMDPSTHYPDFSKGKSGAVGVISGCDCASNQINASNSCFYDADMRAIEQTFKDAYVEFYGLRDGMGAVPYISNNLTGFYITASGQGNQQPGRKMRYGFNKIWFKNFDRPNYVHLVGVRGPNESGNDSVVGFSRQWSVYTFIHQETIEQIYSDAGVRLNFEKTVNNHEFGHQFRTNICSTDPVTHDEREAWCNTDAPQDCPGEPCLMHLDGGTPTNDIRRFCKEDLFLGDPVCWPPNGNREDGSIRGETDLVRSEEGE